MMNEYAELRAEAAELSVKPSLNPQQKRRYAYLLKAIPVVKEGVSIRDFDLQLLNEEAARNGLPQTRIRKQRYTAEQRAKGECLQQMLLGGTEVGAVEARGGFEFRVGETEGNIPAQIGTYTGLGYFVPTDLYNIVKERMAEIDVLFDKDGPCTVIEDTNASPKRITFYNDTLIDTAQEGEAGADGSVSLLQNPGHAVLGSFGFRTPIHPFSIESMQDLDQLIEVEELFERFSSKRLARAIGQKLVTGNGTNQTLGLINALQTNNAPAIVAQGSGQNDGVGTASNSIGSQDMVNLVFAVNKVYRESSSAGYLMSSGTLAQLSALVDKYGQLLNLVQYDPAGKPRILGFPVYICPSLPESGNKDIPIIFGDLSYWHTRLITSAYSRIRVVKEAPGLVENGSYGLQMFMRADGVLATDGSTANAPMSYLIQHS
ncbi:MAG: phage major capsid protein [Candidatus Acidiferrales bacterium]